MGRPKRMRDLVGVLKDKASFLKATLLLTATPSAANAATSFHLAVLRATTHHPIDPPPEYILDDVLSLGDHQPPAASAVVAAVLGRLRRTQSAFVALKCLLTLHHILRRGSHLLRDQLFSHRHLINLSAFDDQSDADTSELSKWARWYAEVLQQNLILSDSLGFYISDNNPKIRDNNPKIRVRIPSKQRKTSLMRELNSLVGMIEQISRVPDSLQYQRISMVYEVMKLVGEDYRVTLRAIFDRVKEFENRIEEELMSDDLMMEDLMNDLKKLEGCKEKVFLMFLNKKKSDGTWDSIGRLRRKLEEEKQRRESMSLVAFHGGELTRLEVTTATESKSAVPRGKRWLDVEWNHVHVNNGPI